MRAAFKVHFVRTALAVAVVASAATALRNTKHTYARNDGLCPTHPHHTTPHHPRPIHQTKPQRQPLSKEERAEAEKLLAGTGQGGDKELQEASAAERGNGGASGGEALLIDPANFFKEFDAWVDTKYPGDRGSATKVKVAFRKVRETCKSVLYHS